MALDDKQDILKIGEMSVAKRAYAVHAFTDPVESLDLFSGNPRGY